MRSKDPNILDPELYAKAERKADRIYDKPSAYKSGFIVKEYKFLGGRMDLKRKTCINMHKDAY